MKISSKVLPRSNSQILFDGRLFLSGLVFSTEFVDLTKITLMATGVVTIIAAIVSLFKYIKSKRDADAEVDRYMEIRMKGFWQFVQFFCLLTITEQVLCVTAAVRWSGLSSSESKGTFALSIFLLVCFVVV